VFLPGQYRLSRPVVVRGNVRRVLGCGGWVDYDAKVRPNFRVADGAEPTVTFEHFSKLGGGIETASDRTVVLRSIGTRVAGPGAGRLFLEDVAGDELVVRNQKVWARQLNIENEGTHLLADRCDLWVLGYKTERGGTLVDTRGGGRTEVLGGFSYTTTAGGLAPMFVNRRSAVFAFFGEVCYTGDPFRALVRETRDGETREVGRGAGGTWPYIGAAAPDGR
jgi:hypothetical protein